PAQATAESCARIAGRRAGYRSLAARPVQVDGRLLYRAARRCVARGSSGGSHRRRRSASLAKNTTRSKARDGYTLSAGTGEGIREVETAANRVRADRVSRWQDIGRESECPVRFFGVGAQVAREARTHSDRRRGGRA